MKHLKSKDAAQDKHFSRSEPKTDYVHYGFSYLSESLKPFAQMHRHDEVELGLPLGGDIIAMFGSAKRRVKSGQFGVFWANQPHGPLQVDPNTRAEVILVPLAWVLSWNLPASFVHRLLNGELVLEPRPEEVVHLDTARLQHWTDLMRIGCAEETKIVLLEIQARLAWLALRLERENHPGKTAAAAELPRLPGQISHFERIVQYIAQHLREDLTVPQIAQSASLHPNYAMRLFRETAGVTILEYLMQHRVSLAQRLLATTDTKILDISEECGFRSPARFYDIFSRLCGSTPAAYRRSLRPRKSHGPRA